MSVICFNNMSSLQHVCAIAIPMDTNLIDVSGTMAFGFKVMVLGLIPMLVVAISSGGAMSEDQDWEKWPKCNSSDDYVVVLNKTNTANDTKDPAG